MSEQDPKRAPVMPGDVLADKYEVERVLGAGGMGIVVAARHRHLKQRVALKFLLPEVAMDSKVGARFLREAQSALTIRSEHVGRVTDYGLLPSGEPFMVMEYLEGKDLARVLADRGRLPIALAVDYLLQAMEALAEAHHAGIVHRDLKPSNLFLTERADGSPLIKVLDFGISKIPKSAETNSKSLTRTAGLIGSPLYMSPEQIRSSKHVDARADIWSLGVILYELVSGTPPFFGEEVNAVLAAIVADEPLPLSQARSDVPHELEAVVMKCLEKRPAARHAGVGALARELAPFGSRTAALSVERVLGVSERRPSDDAPGSVGAGASASSTPTVIASAATAGAWSQRSPDAPAKKSKSVVVGALAVIALGGAAVAVLVSRTQAPGTAGSAAVEPPAAPVSVRPVALSPPSSQRTAPPEISATPLVAPAATVEPSAPPTASAARAPATVTPRRPATKAPKPTPNFGDLIDERR